MAAVKSSSSFPRRPALGHYCPRIVPSLSVSFTSSDALQAHASPSLPLLCTRFHTLQKWDFEKTMKIEQLQREKMIDVTLAASSRPV